MSKQSGRVLHKSIDITRSALNLAPVRKVSPSRAVSRSKGHTNSFPNSASQAALPKPHSMGRSRKSPYLQQPQIPICIRDRPRIRASSPMIKKFNPELLPLSKADYGSASSAYYSSEVQSAATTDGSLLRNRPLQTSSSIPANLSMVGESPMEAVGERLEEKLSDRLSAAVGERQEIEACGCVFAELIDCDKAFGTVLSHIKTAYEEALGVPCDTEKLTEDVKAAEKSLQQEKEERKFALKKLEKLSLENLKLSRALDEKENDCVELQEKLYQISQIDMQEIPKDDQSWQFLISENRSYQDLFDRMEKDLLSFKKREKKLLKLILAMKERGYPIDEIYQEEFQKPKAKKPTLEIRETLEESETEPIADGPSKLLQRPEAVPPLRLSEVEPDSDSDSNPEDSSAASSAHLTEKKKAQEGQPNPHSLGTKSSVDSCKMSNVDGRPLLVCTSV